MGNSGNRRRAAVALLTAALAGASILTGTTATAAVPGPGTGAAAADYRCGDNQEYTGTPPWRKVEISYYNCGDSTVYRRLRGERYPDVPYPCLSVSAGQVRTFGSFNPMYGVPSGTEPCQP
ncbi:hypothetical protein RM572_13230 [Streptomyces sp. DSM 42041]|uniref:Secreted protein n=1 Tax=Streptomyces hazeniae TaxID=3075538 RepID=A0ABU2NRX2_9ACTN|nr:hypothetical protein [Streptomyces sp. DSM 42041]MDT0379730.1 hypothetical protein [Streptomyces sp. DSM 42041]